MNVDCREESSITLYTVFVTNINLKKKICFQNITSSYNFFISFLSFHEIKITDTNYYLHRIIFRLDEKYSKRNILEEVDVSWKRACVFDSKNFFVVLLVFSSTNIVRIVRLGLISVRTFGTR